MAEIRLSKLTNQFSIGQQRLVEFLNEKGADVDMNPNAKVSDSYLPALEAKFGEDLKLKKDSEKVTIKLKEIIEMGSKNKPVQEEEDVPEKEVVIKSNVLNTTPVQPAPAVEEKPAPVQPVAPAPVEEPAAEPEKGGLKIVDKIDLSKFDKKAPAKEEKPAPEPVAEEPVTTPTPVEVPAAPVEEKVVEPAPEVKPEPREVKVEVEKLAGPKVVDKIDLSQFDKKKNNKKRERIGKGGSQKVDVTKVEAVNNAGKKDKNKNNGNNNAGGKDQRRPDQQNAKNGKKNRRDRGADKFKPMTEAEQEEMQ